MDFLNKDYILTLLLLITSATRAEIGCIDNSKYLDTSDGPDFKEYHYVQCNCPCDRYAHSYKRGLCETCLHFRAPKEIKFVKWRE